MDHIEETDCESLQKPNIWQMNVFADDTEAPLCMIE